MNTVYFGRHHANTKLTHNDSIPCLYMKIKSPPLQWASLRRNALLTLIYRKPGKHSWSRLREIRDILSLLLLNGYKSSSLKRWGCFIQQAIQLLAYYTYIILYYIILYYIIYYIILYMAHIPIIQQPMFTVFWSVDINKCYRSENLGTKCC